MRAHRVDDAQIRSPLRLPACRRGAWRAGLFAALCAAGIFGASPRFAALFADPSYQVEYGFRGVARGERLMPVQVLLQGDHQDRDLMIRITGTPMVYLPVELPPNTGKQLFLYTEPATSRLAGGLPRIEIFDGRRRLHEEDLLARSAMRYFVPVVGGPSLQLSGYSTPRITAASLPRQPRGYSGLNGLIVYPGAWEGIHPAALEALSIWVQGGGVLILPTVAGARKLFLPAGHPFGPLKAGRIESKPGFFSWMEHAMGLQVVRPDQVEFEDAWDEATIAAPPSTAWRVFPRDNPGGEEGVALPTVLARQRYGRGDLYFLCFDPSVMPASAEWDARDRFVRTLLEGGRGSILASEDPLIAMDSSARRFVLPGSRGRTSTGWFFLFLVVYLALITPVDYFFVRRLGRPRLTWLTFPAVVIVFSVFAWGLGRGRIGETEYREITWIDAPLPGRATALAHSAIGIYSDTNGRFTITPVPRRAEIRRGFRDSGGAIDYDDRLGTGAVVQKMHIWSDHAYRAVWPAKRLLDTAILYRDSRGGWILRVTGVLPRDPVFWRVKLKGFHRDIPHSAVTTLDGEGWALELRQEGADVLDRSHWDAVGGETMSDALGAFADELYGAGRGGVQAAWVAAVLPGPWPAVNIAERDPARVGATVVRLPLELASEE